eukprot:3810698-Prymnesium_polylepis.1
MAGRCAAARAAGQSRWPRATGPLPGDRRRCRCRASATGRLGRQQGRSRSPLGSYHTWAHESRQACKATRSAGL